MPRRKHSKNVNGDDPVIQEIISLRLMGYKWTAIGRYLNLHHSAIIYFYKKWCNLPSKTTRHEEINKGKIKDKIIYIKYQPKVQVKQVNKYDYLLNEPINPGKNYEEYLGKTH